MFVKGRCVVVGLMALQLAGCGGGDVSSTPTPTPAPTPTAFPIKTTGSFQTIVSTSSFSGHYSTDTIANPSTAAMQTLAVTGRTSEPSISYDAANNLYRLKGSLADVSFGSGNKTASSDYSHVYNVTAGNLSDQVVLYGNAMDPAPASPAPLSLSYTSYGFWRHTDKTSDLTTQTFFVFGYPTGSTDMPKTGSATYQGIAKGIAMTSGPALPSLGEINGSATLAADFALNTVTTRLDLGINGAYQGTGTISSDQFSGAFTSSYASFNGGGFAGGFFGPAAAEMGYAFWLQYINPDPYAGASPAAVRTWFSGVVVGKKN